METTKYAGKLHRFAQTKHIFVAWKASETFCKAEAVERPTWKEDKEGSEKWVENIEMKYKADYESFSQFQK